MTSFYTDIFAIYVLCKNAVHIFVATLHLDFFGCLWYICDLFLTFLAENWMRDCVRCSEPGEYSLQ